MNLIQIQNRLKDLPFDPRSEELLKAYANGMNPDVPPYFALMELQRRNRINQELRSTPPPTGTVKDQLEQQTGLAALQQMRMGQAQQQMMQGAAAQPMPVPEGAPQPDMQPEMTGIANAAAQPGVMRPDVMGMAGGGIVAFAKAGYADDEDDEDTDEEAGAGYGGADTYTYEPTVRPAVTGQASAVAPQRELASRDLPPQDAQDPYDAAINRRAPTGLVNYGSTQPVAAPQGPQSTAQQLAGLQALAAQQRAAVPKAPESPLALRARMAQENPAMYGMLNKPVGQEYLAGLQALQAKQAAEDPKALEQLQRNKRMDFYKALIAAGEATRGQKGLGGLLGGFGKAAIPAMEARAQEEAGIRGQALKREELFNKAKYDVEGLQRAQATGDVKAEDAYKNKLYDTAVKAYVSGNASLAREIGAIAGIREAEIRAAAQTESARTRAAAKGQGGEKKTTDLMEQYKIELDALLADGAPNDAATRKAAMNIAQAQISKSAGTYRAETTAQEKADTWVQTQLLTGPRARELRALRRQDPAAYNKEVEALEAEAQRRFVRPNPAPTRNPPPTAPAPGTPAPPPGFVPR